MTENNEPKQQVFVLGMHRSGTSYLSRALNLCGLYLGPVSDFYDDELHPIIGNPRGHWENIRVIEINDSILNVNDGSWDDVPSSLSKFPAQVTKKISELLDSFYLHNAIAYGFKDPRLILTLDKWLPQFKHLLIVGIFRHPLKVAESLKLRNGFEYKKSLELWKKYNQKLLELLKMHNGFLIDFDWDEEKLLEETKMIANKIGLFKIDLSYWFKEDFKKSDKTYDTSYSLSDDLVELYEELQKFSLKNQNTKYDALPIPPNQYKNIVKDLLKTSNSTYDNIIHVAQNELHIIRNEVDSLTNEITRYQKEIAKYPSEIKQYENQIKENQNEIERYQKELTDKQEEITRYQKEIAKYQEEMNRYQEEVTKYPADLERYQQEITRYQEEIAKYPADLERYQQEITRYQEEISKFQAELDEHKHEIHLIKSSTIFKSIQFFTSKLDRILGKKK